MFGISFIINILNYVGSTQNIVKAMESVESENNVVNYNKYNEDRKNMNCCFARFPSLDSPGEYKYFYANFWAFKYYCESGYYCVEKNLYYVDEKFEKFFKRNTTPSYNFSNPLEKTADMPICHLFRNDFEDWREERFVKDKGGNEVLEILSEIEALESDNGKLAEYRKFAEALSKPDDGNKNAGNENAGSKNAGNKNSLLYDFFGANHSDNNKKLYGKTVELINYLVSLGRKFVKAVLPEQYSEEECKNFYLKFIPLKEGYDKEGYNREGYNREGYHKDGYDRMGYDKCGYNKYGYDKNGYDKYGYDKDGYNKYGYDKDGRKKYDKDGYDKDGYNKYGYDKYGYDRDGYDKCGYDRDGYFKDVFHLYEGVCDSEGFCPDGCSRKGYDRYGYNREEMESFRIFGRALEVRNYLELLIRHLVTVAAYLECVHGCGNLFYCEEYNKDAKYEYFHRAFDNDEFNIKKIGKIVMKLREEKSFSDYYELALTVFEKCSDKENKNFWKETVTRHVCLEESFLFDMIVHIKRFKAEYFLRENPYLLEKKEELIKLLKEAIVCENGVKPSDCGKLDTVGTKKCDSSKIMEDSKQKVETAVKKVDGENALSQIEKDDKQKVDDAIKKANEYSVLNQIAEDAIKKAIEDAKIEKIVVNIDNIIQDRVDKIIIDLKEKFNEGKLVKKEVLDVLGRIITSIINGSGCGAKLISILEYKINKFIDDEFNKEKISKIKIYEILKKIIGESEEWAKDRKQFRYRLLFNVIKQKLEILLRREKEEISVDLL